MKRLLTIFLALLVLTPACRDPFDFDYGEVAEPTVVIDGFITDNGRRHSVRVAYSTTINSRGQVETRFENNATVSIEDDQGGFTVLNNTASGYYLSQPQYAAREGRSYKVVVTLPGGEVYESAFETMPAPSPAVAQLRFSGGTREVLQNNQIQQEEGAVISATIQKDNDRHFYQWVIGRYFIRESALAPQELRFCYVRDFDEPRVELLQDNPAVAGQASEYTYDIDFIPVGADMQFDFGVEGRLLTLDEAAFNFWDNVKTQAENSGGFFDAAPFTIEGNIINQRTGELALGYFGVYRESVDRVFFTEADLGFRVGQYPPCEIPFMATRPHPCEDCRLWTYQENLGPNRPTWWRN